MRVGDKIQRMKEVKILGTGCPKCKQTSAILELASIELGLQQEVMLTKVEDIMEIMKYNVMTTPAVVINEAVVMKGRVPSLEEAKKLLAF